MITPNPDTNPELFERVPDDSLIGEGSLYRDPISGEWTQTEHPGKTAMYFGCDYYRRKPENNSMKWNPIENGPPSTSRTVLIASIKETPLNAGRVECAFWETDCLRWRNAKRETIKAPAMWAEIPTQIAPVIEKPITINADGNVHKVEFLANGDIKVGCTTVNSKTMDQIIERRKERRG